MRRSPGDRTRQSTRHGPPCGCRGGCRGGGGAHCPGSGGGAGSVRPAVAGPARRRRGGGEAAELPGAAVGGAAQGPGPGVQVQRNRGLPLLGALRRARPHRGRLAAAGLQPVGGPAALRSLRAPAAAERHGPLRGRAPWGGGRGILPPAPWPADAPLRALPDLFPQPPKGRGGDPRAPAPQLWPRCAHPSCSPPAQRHCLQDPGSSPALAGGGRLPRGHRGGAGACCRRGGARGSCRSG
mmetsp:Transcript_71949/g.227405  ORF Transcript_71949/g.227405 Transcript_71949/m.227405 type:complete len:239 (-) Transcript_71949:286-1002(-)